jgi:hypothetical protein
MKWLIALLLICTVSAHSSDIRVPQTPSNPNIKIDREPALIIQNPLPSTTPPPADKPTEYCSVVAGCTESK